MMQHFSRKKQILFDAGIVASIAAAIIITHVCLTNGIFDIFPYFYLLPIILIAFSRPKFSIYGTVLTGWLYFMLVWFWQPPDAHLFTLATIRFYIFVSMGVLISVYSQEYYRAEQRKCNLYYHSQAGAFSFNPESGKITDTNPKFARMVRNDPGTLKTKTLADIIPDPAERESFLSRLRDLQVVVDSELGLLAGDGTMRWVLVSSVKTDEDEIVCTVVDITDHKEARNALALANRKLNLLISITGHDILNQVTGLRAAAELEKLRTTDPGTLRFIGQEETAAQNIQRQIAFARNYEGIGVRAPQWQNIGTRVKVSISGMPDPVIEVSPELDSVEIFADPLLDRVFENLIDNSLRHGEGVRLISFSLGQDRNEELVLVYKDDGSGVPEADKERIFEKGFGKNTGLGLFLSCEILSITGLSMKETGIAGKGVRFEIRVPKGKFRFVRPG
ncbi:MAG: PAS domain-containing sensor histidine kinase [Methanoregula sp.]|jgi:PAS domain S-box-containing protein|nr:PAS domain-containing sensor histidine kinase [Methanoregula sp.]